MLPWLRVRLEEVGGRECKEKEKGLFFPQLNLLGEFSPSPRGGRKRSVFFSPLTCWAVYGGHYLTLIAAQASVLGLYIPQLNTLYCTAEET